MTASDRDDTLVDPAQKYFDKAGLSFSRRKGLEAMRRLHSIAVERRSAGDRANLLFDRCIVTLIIVNLTAALCGGRCSDSPRKGRANSLAANHFRGFNKT